MDAPEPRVNATLLRGQQHPAARLPRAESPQESKEPASPSKGGPAAQAKSGLPAPLDTVKRSPTSLTRAKALARSCAAIDPRALALVTGAGNRAACHGNGGGSNVPVGSVSSGGANGAVGKGIRAQRSLVPGKMGPRVVLHNGLSF